MNKLICLLLTLCLGVTGLALADYPSEYVVTHGDRTRKQIALTVDDCYDRGNLRKMHDLCVQYDIPMTVFVIGKQALPEDRELWQAILDHGSEVGNHTLKHPYLTRIKPFNAKNQILLTQEAFDQAIGYHYPLRFLRPPFGYYREGSSDIREMAYNQCNIERIILWDVSETDPNKCLKDVQNGSILLFHTNIQDIHCMEQIIPKLLEEGYEFVTIGEMFDYAPPVTSEEMYVFPR